LGPTELNEEKRGRGRPRKYPPKPAPIRDCTTCAFNQNGQCAVTNTPAISACDSWMRKGFRRPKRSPHYTAFRMSKEQKLKRIALGLPIPTDEGTRRIMAGYHFPGAVCLSCKYREVSRCAKWSFGLRAHGWCFSFEWKVPPSERGRDAK
jgi:hypothetical protein